MRAPWLRILGLLIATRAALFAIGWLVISVINKGHWYHEPKEAIDILFHWDAEWYYRISRDGYGPTPGAPAMAFFPLVPLLARGIWELGIRHQLWAALVLSNTALFLACIGLYKIAEHETRDDKLAFRSVALLLVFPATVFHSNFYTEGTFLALSIWAFWFARQGKWLPAALCAYALGLTRSTSLLIAVPFACELLGYERFADIRSAFAALRRPRAAWLSIFAAPLGVASYFIYLLITTGDAFSPIVVQGGWGRHLAPFWVAFQEAFDHERLYTALVFFGVGILSVAIIGLAAARSRPSLVIYAFGVLAYSVSFATSESMVRLVSVAFPMYLGLALATRRSESAYLGVFGLFAMLASLYVTLLATGYWLT